jgi:tRNA A-37 threonylcarbamoyl transferase component Bud32
VELNILANPNEQARLLDVPWDLPLVDWPSSYLVALPRGISRHVVRFVRIDKTVYAVKEINEKYSVREYRLLRDLERIDFPSVRPVGVATGRQTHTGEPLDSILITRHLTWSLPYRAVFSGHLRPDTVDRLLDALVVMIGRLHLIGFVWGDCSLSNTLFRRDAGAFAAYLVDAETGELHSELSDGQRLHDIETAHVNIAGELMDLQAGGLLHESIDPIELAGQLPVRYDHLWCQLTGVEEFTLGERWRMAQRIERLNALGFDVDEINIVTDIGGRSIRIQPKVVDPGHHSRRLMRLTGIDAEENQARRLLNDLDAYRVSTNQQAESEQVVAHEWLHEVYQPVVEAIPREMRGKLEPLEVFHEVLEHRWYTSEQRGYQVPLEEAVASYLADVLAHKPEEVAVLGSAVRPGGAPLDEDDLEATQPFRLPWDEVETSENT